MKADRKLNIIRALKREIAFYKRQSIPMPVNIINKAELNHLRLCTTLSKQEVMQMPKDDISLMLVYKMVELFNRKVMDLPIETKFDEEFGMYKAILDLWVKPKEF